MNRRVRDLIRVAESAGVARVRTETGGEHLRLVGSVGDREFRMPCPANGGCPRVLRNVRAQIRREVARLRNQEGSHGVA